MPEFSTFGRTFDLILLHYTRVYFVYEDALEMTRLQIKYKGGKEKICIQKYCFRQKAITAKAFPFVRKS